MTSSLLGHRLAGMHGLTIPVDAGHLILTGINPSPAR
jgi:hypothetical protein